MQTDALLCGLMVTLGALALAGFIWLRARLRRKPAPTGYAGVYPDHETGPVLYEYRVGRAAPAVWLHLRVEVASGAMRWTVTDPEGVIRWADGATGGVHVDETREMSPVVGTWLLRLELFDASGFYGLHWTTRRPRS